MTIPPLPADAPRLRLLATTDLHGHLLPWDYDRDAPAPALGLAGLAPLIRTLRAEALNRGDACLLVDNGDLLQGTALAEALATRAARGRPHPILAALDALNYDAMALGNHDFNFGLPALTRMLRSAGFPVLCANLTATAPHPGFAPSVLLHRSLRGRPLRIGLVGLAPPQTLVWDRALLAGQLTAAGIVEAGRAEAGRLRAAGAHLVVALAHTGIGRADAPATAEDAALALAASGAVDAIVAGHSHARLPGPAATAGAAPEGIDAAGGRLAGIPFVMAGTAGSDLGLIDIALLPVEAGEAEAAGAARGQSDGWETGGETGSETGSEIGGGWRIAGAECRLILNSRQADAAIAAIAGPAHRAVRRATGRVVGHASHRLHTHLALVAPSPALAFVAAAQRRFAAARLGSGTPPILAAAAPYRSGHGAGGGDPAAYTDIAPGPLNGRHLNELSPFPNRLCAVSCTGADLRRWLDIAAGLYLCPDPGAALSPLLDPGFPGYNFDHLLGLDYVIDIDRPSGAPGFPRIAALTHCGAPVADTDNFIVAATGYRVSGGGGYDFLTALPAPELGPETLGDILKAGLSPGTGAGSPAGTGAGSPAGTGAGSPAGTGVASSPGTGAGSPPGTGAASPPGPGAASPPGPDAASPPGPDAPPASPARAPERMTWRLRAAPGTRVAFHASPAAEALGGEIDGARLSRLPDDEHAAATGLARYCLEFTEPEAPPAA